MIRKQTLTIRDTNIMKGISMLMIMFHNYFHQITPKTGENEFNFSVDYFQRFIGFLASEPLHAVRHIFSYFGHYGVQIFILVSSYGLYISYKDRDIEWLRFMKKRILKLYPTLLIGIVFVIILYIFSSSRFPSVFLVKESLIKLTLLYGFIPGSALSVSGPWWFFSAIIQLYAFFPLLKRIVKKYGPNSMLITAFIFIGLTIAFNTFADIANFSIYYTFVGQIPVFALGIYFAARSEIKISVLVFLAALIMFAAANFYEMAYYFSFISVTILLLTVMIWLLPFIQRFKKLATFLAFTGGISLFLFVIHGSLRFPFITLAEAHPNPFLTIALSIVFVTLSYIMALWVRIIEKQIQEFIASGYSFKTLLTRIKENDF
ncbi:acyltransferase [Cryomorpha ignava]|uniref:Acyltransferase n=1 Tax=Cryomorpha ignava TaxID=101383 RepID=A0A7K3WP50_9FLAO|nr:acyltransferase family protein [Cryomorpha ignava]NEN23439.1 acyltransferase [Cryomorpha ignava]